MATSNSTPIYTNLTDATKDSTRVCDQIAIWTHYYDAKIVSQKEYLIPKFDPLPREEIVGSTTVELHEYRYLDALNWQGFSGGTAPTSRWFTRQGLLDVLREFGYSITIGHDHIDHPNGPAILLFGSR